jgi:hypothetical protein
MISLPSPSALVGPKGRSPYSSWLRIGIVVAAVTVVVVAMKLLLFLPVDHEITQTWPVTFQGPGLRATFSVPGNTVLKVTWATRPSANVPVCPSPTVNTVLDIPCESGPNGNYTLPTYPPNGGGLVALFAMLPSPSTGPVNITIQTEYHAVYAS